MHDIRQKEYTTRAIERDGQIVDGPKDEQHGTKPTDLGPGTPWTYNPWSLVGTTATDGYAVLVFERDKREAPKGREDDAR